MQTFCEDEETNSRQLRGQSHSAWRTAERSIFCSPFYASNSLSRVSSTQKEANRKEKGEQIQRRRKSERKHTRNMEEFELV